MLFSSCSSCLRPFHQTHARVVVDFMVTEFVVTVRVLPNAVLQLLLSAISSDARTRYAFFHVGLICSYSTCSSKCRSLAVTKWDAIALCPVDLPLSPCDMICSYSTYSSKCWSLAVPAAFGHSVRRTHALCFVSVTGGSPSTGAKQLVHHQCE